MSGGDGRDGGSDAEWSETGDAGEADASSKYRCAWCGKPHERNDPPCDNCGHHKFEKAVVPVAPEDPDHEREPVWVCPECGRVHQKNSPPCSRCGSATLERRIPDDADYAEELSGTSYVDLLSARYVVGFAVALLAGAVLLLAILGVVTLPGTGHDVPGSAAAVGGVDLRDAESAFVADLNERRANASLDAYDRRAKLDDAARLYNRGVVAQAYDGGSVPSGERVREELDGACGGDVGGLTAYSRSFDGDSAAFDSPEALAVGLVDAYVAEAENFYETSNGLVGVDVHAAPDERVYVTVVVC
ncbi:MAG: hypothetical protein ABEJ26_10665 [Halosimplex sp.]